MLRLLTRNAIPSARLLRDALLNNFPQIGRAYVTKNSNKIKRNDVVIRYGNIDQTLGRESGYNSIELINLCANKSRFDSFARENNFYSPVYHRTIPTVEDFPLIIRQTLTGFGGKGIIVCKTLEEFKRNWNGNYYWTKFVKTAFELRLHVVDGEILRIFRKDMENEEDLPIRNNHSCHFSLRTQDNYPKLITEVRRLCELNPFNRGIIGLDVGWDSVNKKYFIFEANSSPGLNENTADEYSKRIGENILALL